MTARNTDGAATFAIAAVALAAVTFVVAVATVVRSDGSDASGTSTSIVVGGERVSGAENQDDGEVADPSATVEEITSQSAAAMGAVTSVEFRLSATGAPIYIDQFDRIALTSMHGQFAVPGRAQAELAVKIDGNLNTRLGAVAIDDEIWLSNPVTGDFETLPAGYDIDPSRFFDPVGGWQPLLAGLQQVTLVGVEDRGGQRYHIRGTATPEQMSNITAGLVGEPQVVIDLWVHPTTFRVTATEFETSSTTGTIAWMLDLSSYGEAFQIDPPDNIRTTATTAAAVPTTGA